MVKLQGISKNFGSIQALHPITFEVKPGELFGLIGPDGAGKTTLFRILATLLLPSQGTATVKGWDVVRGFRKIRKITGYMPGQFSLYPDLSVEENLRFYARVFRTRVEENYELIRDIYGYLEPFRSRRAGQLSGGMKQKLALSCALVHRPEILLLDEPTTGVDPVSRAEFWNLLRNLKKQGLTILASTPYMDEAAHCDRIALIRQGKLLGIDTPQRLQKGYSKYLYRISGQRPAILLPLLRQLPEEFQVYASGDVVSVACTDSDGIREIAALLEKTGQGATFRVNPAQPDIEDCFIALMEEKHES
ncbi:MAG: ABC transporter ATP-binding protein [Bacteroidales bacterium]